MHDESVTVKQGDTAKIKMYVEDEDGNPVDLTGATVIVRARRQGDGIVSTWAHTVTNAVGGELSVTTGLLDPVRYYAEAEVTKAGVVTTAPSSGYLTVRVIAQIG